MKGVGFHLQVWLASVGFFYANINLLRVILNSYCGYANEVDHERFGQKDHLKKTPETCDAFKKIDSFNLLG
jgi:hypothetical protein